MGNVLPFVARPMRESDIPTVMSIERLSFPTPWPEAAYYYELRFGANARFLVLQRQQEEPAQLPWYDRLRGRQPDPPALIGYVGVRLRDAAAHISTIAVHPDWRGQGVGKLILLISLEEASRHGAQRVTLEVRASNTVAQKLYAQVGFTQIGVRPAYYQDGEDGLTMLLEPLNEACLARLCNLRQMVEERLLKTIE